jgi:integrase
MEAKIKLLDRMRNVMRLKHMSLRTEQAYVSWVKRFTLFHDKRPRRVPTVFTAEETQAMLAQLHGAPRLMAGLLYGAGLRLMECVFAR